MNKPPCWCSMQLGFFIWVFLSVVSLGGWSLPKVLEPHLDGYSEDHAHISIVQQFSWGPWEWLALWWELTQTVCHCFFLSFDISNVQTSTFFHQAFCILVLFQMYMERDFPLKAKTTVLYWFPLFWLSYGRIFCISVAGLQTVLTLCLSSHSSLFPVPQFPSSPSSPIWSPFSCFLLLVWPFFLSSPLSFLPQAAFVIEKLANHIVC